MEDTTNVVEYSGADIEGILKEIAEKRETRKEANLTATAAKTAYDAVWTAHKARMESDSGYADAVKEKKRKLAGKETVKSVRERLEMYEKMYGPLGDPNVPAE